MNELLSIGAVSKKLGITIRAIRYYEEIGFLNPFKSETGYRYFNDSEIFKLQKILLFKSLGLSLSEIKNIVDLKDSQLFNNILDERKVAIEKEVAQLLSKIESIDLVKKIFAVKNIVEIEKLQEELNRNISRWEEFKMGEVVMQVKVITLKESIKSIGVDVRVPFPKAEDDNPIEDLFNKYWEKEMRKQIPNRKMPEVQFGICSDFDGKTFSYMISEEVENYSEIPNGFKKFEIPSGEYAVITFKAGTFEELVGDTISKASDYLHSVWLPESDYVSAGTFDFEVYDDRCRRLEKPEMDIYHPIKLK